VRYISESSLERRRSLMRRLNFRGRVSICFKLDDTSLVHRFELRQGHRTMPDKLSVRSAAGEDVELALPADVVSAARLLPYDPQRYFAFPEQTALIALGALTLSRARPSGIRRAVDLMAESLTGKIPVRAPIRVTPISGGRYLVLDGNSTVAIAAAAGWFDIPCIVEGPDQ
jgi:hypothetical protein